MPIDFQMDVVKFKQIFRIRDKITGFYIRVIITVFMYNEKIDIE